ncbi:M24 family metallopeptidase [candidate division KSB1 bacterium]|nr:M24 family metallopeptidase [candidate division KSB1 bacterium]
MISQKIQQAVSILNEQQIDMWLIFVRETSSTPDPMLDLLLGTHCTWASAFILTSTGKKIALVGSLDRQNIIDHAPYKVIDYVGSIKDLLISTMKEIDPARIAINTSQNDVMADGLTHGMYEILCEYLKDTPYVQRFESSESLVAALRGRKVHAELEAIKSAIKETLDIFEKVSKYVKVGMTEKQVAGFIVDQMEKKGLSPAWDPEQCPAVFTGPNSAGAHAGPTDRVIESGHIMNIDFGVRKNGYVSDLQRTWYFMKPDEIRAPEEVIRGFETIRDAIRNAAAALKPGIEGWTIDHIARQFIVDAGYEEFQHGLGHQVGRKAHDGSALLCPRWDRYKKLPFLKVEAGQVYTLEPRLTVEGAGIATIEEIVVVKGEGVQFLSDPQQELWVIKS